MYYNIEKKSLWHAVNDQQTSFWLILQLKFTVKSCLS